MNSRLSLGLTISLMISTSPLVADEKTEMPTPVNMHTLTTQGPIAKAIASEAIRLGAERSLRQQRSPNFARTWSSVGTGALIGFGVGAALGMTVGQEACLNEPRWHCAKVGIPFAAIGALVAWLHK